MKLKTSVAALCAVGLMNVTPIAHADLFTFDSNGVAPLGVVTGAAVIDQAPGNTLALGGGFGAGGPAPVGSTIFDLFQANLNSILGPTSNVLFSNGTGGAFFTFVAGFSETVVSSSSFNGGAGLTTNFTINPGGFFKMCAQGAGGNDLAGTGFGCAGNGILFGTALGGNATQTGFAQLGPFPALDQSPNGNDRSPTLTTTSSGAANLTLQITFADPNYFPDLTAGSVLTLSFVNSSNITPFAQVDPSFLFSLTGVTADTPDNIGLTNGISGPNFQFQADANQSFTRQAVPEPGTLALLGLAAAVTGGFIGRRRKA